jgi:ribosomal subunit interface protein
MNIDIHTKDVELNAPLRAFIEEKMADVERLVGSAGPASVRVEVGIPSHHHHKGEVFYAEANLELNGHLLRAEATGHDLHAAIVDVKDELKVQIGKLKDRLREDARRPSET